MKKLLIKEFIIYFTMLIILAILMHGSDLPHRFTVLPLSKAWHPFVYTFIIYLIVLLFRLLAGKIKKLLVKNSQ